MVTPSRARLAGSALYVAAWPALLFALAGDVRWIQAWLFTGWLLGLFAVITLWMYFKDPALLAERHRRSPTPSASEQRDRALVLLMFVGFVFWIVLMPLDARRFHWTPDLPLPAHATGALLLLLSAFFLFRAFHDNTYLSALTRVQSERKQRVVSSGVYAFVRHPMYLGILLMFAGTPLLLGSLAGLLVASAIAIVLVVRIGREERLLIDELEGYADYQQTVRYRLLPPIW